MRGQPSHKCWETSHTSHSLPIRHYFHQHGVIASLLQILRSVAAQEAVLNMVVAVWCRWEISCMWPYEDMLKLRRKSRALIIVAMSTYSRVTPVSNVEGDCRVQIRNRIGFHDAVELLHWKRRTRGNPGVALVLIVVSIVSSRIHGLAERSKHTVLPRATAVFHSATVRLDSAAPPSWLE
jgi:hypothetical protein